MFVWHYESKDPGRRQICTHGLFDMQRKDLLSYTVYLRSLGVTLVYFLFTRASQRLWKWSIETVGRRCVHRDFFFFLLYKADCLCGHVGACSKNWKRSEWSWHSITEPWIAAWCLNVTGYTSDCCLDNCRRSLCCCCCCWSLLNG